MKELTSAKKELQNSVIKRFGKPLNSVKSFEELALKCNVSVQTLRRFFGKIESEKELGKTTLSLISRYAGFDDWEDFRSKIKTKDHITEQDRISIEKMAVFFETGEKYAIDYDQNTLNVDVLNEYVKTIYRCRQNFEYFYILYSGNNWVCDYIFAWLPNYNWFGQNWFRKLMAEQIKNTRALPVKVALTNFLFFGSFLSGGKVDFKPEISYVKNLYNRLVQEFPYMPYHDMRYHTVLLMDAKSKSESADVQNFIRHYRGNLQNSVLEELQKQELILFFCNTLIWLEDFETAFSFLKKMKTFPENFSKSTEKHPVHFFGLNMAFVKTTFGLVWLANGNKEISNFELADEDFTTVNGLLYNDYISVMNLAKYILIENTAAKKKAIFLQLKHLVEKTNYFHIYKVLETLDPKFPHYSS